MKLIYNTANISVEDKIKGIEQFLRFVAGEADISFQFGGIPCTDGKTVWLGNASPDDPDYDTLVLGHGLHEIMHITDTQMDLARYVMRFPNFLFLLFNSFEDIRIDALGAKRYAGYKPWREELGRVLMKKGKLPAAEPQALSAAGLLVMWIHCTLLARLGYEWAQKCLPRLDEAIALRLPADMIKRLQKDTSAALSTTSTIDTFKLAQEIAGLCTLMRNKEDEFSDEARARGGNGDEECARQSTEDFELSNSTNTSEETRAFLPSPVNKALEERASEFLNAALEDSQTKADLPCALRTFTLEELLPAGMVPEKVYKPALTKTPVARPWPKNPANNVIAHDAQRFREAFLKSMDEVLRLENRFRTLFLTIDEDADARHAVDGQCFSADWISQLANRRIDIFEAPQARKNISAEITLLLDRSGSMGIVLMTKAKLVVAALLSALKSIYGCTARAAVFPGPEPDDKISLVMADYDSAAAGVERLAGVTAYGSTPIAEALMWAKESFTRRARDKLLLVITDGRFPSDVSASSQAAFDTLGIELAILSIDADNTKAARNVVQINQVKELESAMIKLMARTHFCQALRNG